MFAQFGGYWPHDRVQYAPHNLTCQEVFGTGNTESHADWQYRWIMTDPIDELLAEIDRWLKRTKMKASRLGMLSAGNPRAVARIKDETGRIHTLRGVLRYIRSNPHGER